MCCLEYNLKTMSKKAMAELIRDLVKDKEFMAERAQSYKKQMLEYENFANKRMYKLDKDNNDLTVENIKLKDENDQWVSDYEKLSKKYCELKEKHNTFIEELVDCIKVNKENAYDFKYKPGEKPDYKMTKKEQDEWDNRFFMSEVDKACDALSNSTETTRKLGIHLEKRSIYLSNPKMHVPFDFMLEDAKYSFPFLKKERIFARTTFRTNVIRIYVMYGKSYYYDFNRQTLMPVAEGE